MTDELRERLNEFRAASAFANSEDVQWLVDRVEEAEARAADLADRELTALRTMEKAIKELAGRDAKLAAVERTITDASVTYSTFCGEECCKDRIAKTCSPMMVERDAIRAALSLSVPTSPQDALQKRLYDECVTASWPTLSFGEEIAHLHEEVSEAFRAYRLTKDAAKVWTDDDGKPHGVPIEFADVLIGLFYNAELHGFDLLAAVEQKHAYNLTRDYQAEGRALHPSVPTSPAAAPWQAKFDGRREDEYWHKPERFLPSTSPTEDEPQRCERHDTSAEHCTRYGNNHDEGSDCQPCSPSTSPDQENQK